MYAKKKKLLILILLPLLVPTLQLSVCYSKFITMKNLLSLRRAIRSISFQSATSTRPPHMAHFALYRH